MGGWSASKCRKGAGRQRGSGREPKKRVLTRKVKVAATLFGKPCAELQNVRQINLWITKKVACP